jgi:hypothetical protein
LLGVCNSSECPDTCPVGISTDLAREEAAILGLAIPKPRTAVAKVIFESNDVLFILPTPP